MNPRLKIKKEQLSIEDRLKNIEEHQDFIEQAVMGISEMLDDVLKSKIDDEKKLKTIESGLKVLKARTEHVDKFTIKLCRN